MALDEDIAFLRRIPTFRVLGPDGLRVLAISAELIHLRAGDTLFEEGEPADCAYAMVAGSLKFRHAKTKVTDEPMIARVGSLIGETALIIDTQRPVTAVALEPSTLMRVSRVVFLRMLEGDPDAAIALRRMISGRIDAVLDDLDVVLPRFENQPQ